MFKTFNFKLFSWIALGFMCFTVIGTLSHELGHCAMAKYWVVFFYLPKNKIVTFLSGGLVGGVLGFLIWFAWLGKYILP
jgi:hypothetical protein